MRVTVTGATGSIGLASVHMLVRAGHEVRAFVRSRDKFFTRTSERQLEVVEGDILDSAAAAAALEGADAVVHCVNFPPRLLHLSIDAMRNILAARASGTRVIFPGNLWVYGPTDTERVGPGHPKDSPARLGAIGSELEEAVRAAGGTVVRFPDVYGPGVRAGRMARIFERALAGKAVYYPGNLERREEFAYIGDVARALVSTLAHTRAQGAEYSAPGFAITTPREFVSPIFVAAGHSPRLRSIPLAWLRRIAPIHPRYRVLRDLLYLYEGSTLLDGTLIRRELGWIPEIDYAEGVRRTVRWMRSTRFASRGEWKRSRLEEQGPAEREPSEDSAIAPSVQAR